MDRNFYEFWGQLFLSLAKGQKQIEDFRKWFGQGLMGYESLNAMFRKAYGLDRIEEESPDYGEIWKKSVETFQKSFQEGLSLLDVVPRGEYEKLAQKCAALEKSVAEQEETIRTLKRLLTEEANDAPAAAIEDLQKLLRNQQDQFQELLKNMTLLFDKAPEAVRGVRKKGH
ncbi:MAG: hypothetical protein QM278_00400 [Pseudomonadota bacterium]|nr:hypothetical protein [Pseudomonadota bacterium]